MPPGLAAVARLLCAACRRVNVPVVFQCFYFCGAALIREGISNDILYNVLDEMTCPFPNFNGAAFEICGWISNLISRLGGRMITYPCWDSS